MPNDSLISARQVAVQKARRVVVKIGTGVLTASGGLFDRPRFDSLCSELARVASARQLVVVSSGAVALGVERLGLKSRPKEIPGKQAAAAVGQSRLMRLYDDALGSFDRIVAQVLLTHADIQSRTRYLNARHAMERLLERGAIPIINENDTVSVEELKFGDNDTLAGMVVDLVGADALVILTDIDGVYTADPKKDPSAVRFERISYDEVLAKRLQVMDSTAISLCMDHNLPILVFDMTNPENIVRAVRGEPIGTIVG